MHGRTMNLDCTLRWLAASSEPASLNLLTHPFQYSPLLPTHIYTKIMLIVIVTPTTAPDPHIPILASSALLRRYMHGDFI